MQCNLSRVQAEHGQVLVDAASHLIFRRRHPSQALITTQELVRVGLEAAFQEQSTLQSLVSVMLVHKDIIYTKKFSLMCQVGDI